MEKKEYLSEEKYQKTKLKITIIAIIVLVVGLGIGGYMIYLGVAKPGTAKVEELKKELEDKKSELEAKGVTFDHSTKYDDGEAYDLKIITEAMDPSFSHCEFDEYKDNSITKEYCAAKNSVSDSTTIPLIMFGAFICLAACMFSFSIFMTAKQREINAFATQQAMPVEQEKIEKMAPTVGEAAGEIAKGIKKGLEDSDEENK